MTTDSTSEQQYTDEIRNFLDERLGAGEWSHLPLRGDASTRRYARVRTGDDRQLILTWYPSELRGQLDRYLACQRSLASTVNVPELIASEGNMVLQQDVGDTTLLAILREDRERGRELYRQAVDQLMVVQSCESAELPNPPFDVSFFLTELEMTNEYYVRRLTGHPGLARDFSAFFHELAESLTEHPYVICHRDYHGENLHVVDGRLWVLDFQDMRMGPDTYDLASLLRDRGVVRILGKEAEADLLRYYAGRIGAGPEIFVRYHETLLQRTIKIIGTFARQSIERERHHYLDYIPAALETIAECAERLPRYRGVLDSFPGHFERPQGETT